jgi:hypothetical protein
LVELVRCVCWFVVLVGWLHLVDWFASWVHWLDWFGWLACVGFGLFFEFGWLVCWVGLSLVGWLVGLGWVEFVGWLTG